MYIHIDLRLTPIRATVEPNMNLPYPHIEFSQKSYLKLDTDMAFDRMREFDLDPIESKCSYYLIGVRSYWLLILANR